MPDVVVQGAFRVEPHDTHSSQSYVTSILFSQFQAFLTASVRQATSQLATVKLIFKYVSL